MYWVRQWKSVAVPSASRLWLMEDLLPGQHTKVFSFSEGPNQWVRKFFIFWNNDYLCHQWKTTLAEKAELILEHPGAQWLDHGPKSWVESSQAEGGCEAEFLIYIGCSRSWIGNKEILQTGLWIQPSFPWLLWDEQKSVCHILSCLTEIGNYLFLVLPWWGKTSKKYLRLIWPYI